MAVDGTGRNKSAALRTRLRLGDARAWPCCARCVCSACAAGADVPLPADLRMLTPRNAVLLLVLAVAAMAAAGGDAPAAEAEAPITHSELCAPACVRRCHGGRLLGLRALPPRFL